MQNAQSTVTVAIQNARRLNSIVIVYIKQGKPDSAKTYSTIRDGWIRQARNTKKYGC